MNEQKDFEDGVDTTALDTLGARCYGEQWPNVRSHNIKRLKGDDPAPLGQKELNLLVNGLKKLVNMRRKDSHS